MDAQEKIKLNEPERIVIINDRENLGIEEHLYMYIFSKCLLRGSVELPDILESLNPFVEFYIGSDRDKIEVRYASFRERPEDYDEYVSIED